MPKFLSENEISNDYVKGVFLHLITDYLFFNDFIEANYLNTVSYNDFVKDLYYSYDYTNEYLLNKYNLDLSAYEKIIDENINNDKNEKETTFADGNNILPYDKLDAFIERVSNINLEKYKIKLLANNINILP